MPTKLRRYAIPLQSPEDQISNKVKKARFVKGILENSTKELTPFKIKQIAKDVGWGARPQDALKDEEVQQILKPIADQLIQIRQDVVEALANKNFNNEKTTDLADIMDKLTKNIQLLTGGETEKHKVVFGWETNELNSDNLNVNNHSLSAAQLGDEASQLSTTLEGLCTTS